MSIQGGMVLMIATIAACMDMISEKIANGLIFLGWILGMSYQIYREGIQGGFLFILGAVIPIFLLSGLFFFRMIGAGDIKLFSVLGGIMGASPILTCIVVSFIFGAILSAVFIIVCGNLKQRIQYLTNYLILYSHTKKRVPYYKRGNQLENIHFSVPILLAAMLYAGGLY